MYPTEITSFTVKPFSKQYLSLNVLDQVRKKMYLLLLLALTVVSADPFKTIASWKKVDYNFPNETLRKSYEDSKDYIQEHVVPLGVNVFGDKLFVTVPRWRKGVPATLNYISLKEAEKGTSPSQLLNPYPDWESNDIHSPDAIINVLRVRIDACDRLWAVDSGVNDIFGEFIQVAPKKLIAIDLKTDKVILRYNFKDSDLKPDTFFADTVIDVDPKNCDDAYVYNSDLGGYGLVVYSLAKNDSWRIQHNYFHMESHNGFYNVNGLKFQWTDGMFGMVLTPPKEDGSKTLYFHPMSGIHEYSVSTSLLKNQTALADRFYYEEFKIEGNKGPMTQGTTSMLDPETGIIYFTQLNRNAIACWDTKEKLSPDTFRIAAKDDENLIFPNDIVIEPKTRQFYCLSDNLPVLQYSTFDYNQTNFFIHTASLDDLTAICQAKKEWNN